MKYSRKYIIENAFYVFLSRGYDSTSISILQQELKMSRGAMYRYFKNKEELFISVIDEYFFKPNNLMIKEIGKDKNQKLSELIEETYKLQKHFVKTVYQMGITHTSILNYTALMIQAAKYYPDFVNQMKKISTQIKKIWKSAIENSITYGEIKENTNVDVMVRLFTAITSNESSAEDHTSHKLFAKKILTSMKQRKQTLDYLFELIKK